MAKFVYVRALEFEAETEEDAWKKLEEHLLDEQGDSLIHHPCSYWALDEMESEFSNILDKEK